MNWKLLFPILCLGALLAFPAGTWAQTEGASNAASTANGAAAAAAAPNAAAGAPGAAGTMPASVTPVQGIGLDAGAAPAGETESRAAGLLRFASNAFSGAGAPFMWAILIVSAFSVAIALDKVVLLMFKTSGKDDGSLEEITKLVRAHRMEDARRVADRLKTPFGRIASRVLSLRPGHSKDELQNVVDEAYLAETPQFHRRLPLLAVSANLSTLLGLLGTIAGLVIAFEAVAHVAAAQRTAALAGGISVAMATTGFGLTVAIPTLAMHGLLGGRADRALEDIEARMAVLTNVIEESSRSSHGATRENTKQGTRNAKLEDMVTAGKA
ncbi:MAG: MotA/TolQ/ExbB proton channel family protein [Gemmatimonadetes bacterium]|nr:MotA/TolQ/ExbB proton channel family protein [Gemmatimonadota bacterium]